MVAQTFKLNETTKAVIDAAIASGRYASAEDYLADLVARDHQRIEAERQAGDYLSEKIEENRASGYVSMTSDELRQSLEQVHQRTTRGETGA
jgi:Arc/MetJ-type ribon-helix-helix transcriptional regulator